MNAYPGRRPETKSVDHVASIAVGQGLPPRRTNEVDAREDLAAGYRRWQQAIRAGLAAMADRGEFLPGTDIDRLAIALLAAVQADFC
ncbi:MAG: TetR/AcrR family transcriptional regulator, transcriptional repressor for nem operon [Mycobacterium sp.]|nr:TetR/AcrR family transcriptional regulator, transcriptional repressor for nem operon [Mycobacterium sp.]